MENQRYVVVLSYTPDNLEIHRKVIAALARIDAKAAGRIETAKVTGRIVLKRDADLELAKRLKKCFHDTGARCEVRKAKKPSVRADGSPQPSVGPENPSPQKTAPGLMTCPNCGYEQVQDLECRNCGIIVSKTRPRSRSEQRPTTSDRQANSQKTAQPSPQEKLTAKFQFVAGIIRKIHHSIGTEKWTGWAKKVADRLIGCVLAFIIALVAQVGSAIVMKMLWYLYIATTTGEHWVESHPEQAKVIQQVAIIDPLTLGLDTTLLVLALGLLVACTAQLSHIFRYLFMSQGFFGKLVLWYLPFIWLAAWTLGWREPYPDIILASTMVAVPAVFMLSSCLYLARAVIPEIGELGKIFAIITKNKDKTWGYIVEKIRLWFDTVKQVD